jgi:replicative DNA helicase
MHEHGIEDDLALPPHSIEAESSVIGGLLLDNPSWDRVGDLLTESDFYRFEHRSIFGAIAALVNANKPADVVTVFEHLKSQGKTDEAGGLAYINALAQYVPSAANIRRYAEIVAARSTQRRLLSACTEAREIAASHGEDVVGACNQIQALFEPIAQQRTAQEPRAVADFAVVMLDRIQDLHDGRQQPGIQTGFSRLDRHLVGGLKAGKQIVIAARPSIGKTSLATAIAQACAQSGHPAAVLSQEMEGAELVDRITSSLGRIDLTRLTTGQLEDGEWSRLADAVETLRTLPLYIDDQAALSLHEIRAKARKLKRTQGIRVLVIDYLQLCASSDQRQGSNRHHQLEEISRGLKALAKQLGITVILLSQLNREVEKRTGARPVLADLKESGAIEEDADVVILLSKDGDLSDGRSIIHAELAKNRGGKRNVFVKFAFSGAHQTWAESNEQVMPVRQVKTTRHFTDDIE